MTPSRTRWQTIIRAVLCVLGLMGCREGRSTSVHGAVTWRSDASTRWMTFDSVPNFQIAATGGFAVAGDDLYVADLRASRVAELRREASGWRFTRDLPRVAGMQFPRTLAVLDNGQLLAILDGRDKLFLVSTRSGVSRVEPELPCHILLPQLTSGPGDALFLTGDCRFEGDTVYGILAGSADHGRHFHLIDKLPRYGTDGSWGSILGARKFVTLSSDTIAFGTGAETCLRQYTVADARRVSDDCSVPAARYRGIPPSHWDARQMQTMQHMRSPVAAQWPSPLISYLDRMEVTSGRVFVRLVRADTVELQLVARGETRPLVAAALDGFRGCVSEGCLWLSSIGRDARIRLVTGATLDSLASSATTLRTSF